jgi:general secretion pathway protein I
MKQRSRESGFSVIEALVALAIVAVALVPLIGLQAQVSRNVVHQQQVREAVGAQRNALEVLREINVMSSPQGMMMLQADQSMRWRATAISQPVRSTRQGSGEGDFRIMLYDVEVDVSGLSGAPPTNFRVTQLGWQRLDLVAADRDDLRLRPQR